ncbi:MAG: hypothetical protein OEM42_09620 [Deltaproteobacteria bacterium]|nr:hypothetical protein [Deltaproteobacteria bacterium]MDH3384305.1 hypothetical protein [Deltaproteobacteria bacterium]
MKHLAILGTALLVFAFAAPAVAGDKEHGSMHGMSGEKPMEGHGSMHDMKGESPAEGHGMMAMGHRVFEGTVGPWNGEIRLVDMKAQMAKSKVSEKMKAKMKNTHHLMVSLTDTGTKKHVSEGKGSVTVTGPDKQQSRYEFTGMQGHFGADVALDKPGQYEFDVEIESGEKKGTVSFTKEIK